MLYLCELSTTFIGAKNIHCKAVSQKESVTPPWRVTKGKGLPFLLHAVRFLTRFSLHCTFSSWPSSVFWKANSLLHFPANEDVNLQFYSSLFHVCFILQKLNLLQLPCPPICRQRHLHNLPTAHMCVTQMSSPPLAATASDLCSTAACEKRTARENGPRQLPFQTEYRLTSNRRGNQTNALDAMKNFLSETLDAFSTSAEAPKRDVGSRVSSSVPRGTQEHCAAC